VIAWHLSAKPDVELVMVAFKKAYLRLSVFSYIEGYYNSKRPHSSLG